MDAKTSYNLTKWKLMGTVLVVLVHGYNLLGYADYVSYNPFIQFFQMLASTAILILFTISGYLLFRKDFRWAENMKKKWHSLAIPFLIWNSFWMLFQILGIYLAPQFFDKPDDQSIWGWFVYYFGIPFYKAPVYSPLWYIQALFILNAVAPLIKWVLDRFPTCVTICLLLLLWFIPSPYKLWYNGVQSVVFFVIGGLFARKKCPITLEKEGKWVAILCGIVLVALALIPDLRLQSYWARFILPLACIVVCVGTAALPMDKMLQIMPHFFLIYVLHGKPLSILQVLYSKWIPQTALTVTMGYFLLPVVIIAVCIFVSWVWKRYFPRLYAIATGSR